MINNLLRVAVRNLWKQRFYSAVNILGFSIGLTVVILISLFVIHELSFDRFHAKAKRIARVVENQYYTGQPVFPVAVTPVPLGPALKSEYPDILEASRLANTGAMFKKGDEKFPESGAFVDPSFLEMFSFEIVAGNSNTPLNSIENIIIDEDLATKYFGEQDPIGQSIILNQDELIVSAVMKNFPRNSHLKKSYLRPFASIGLSEDALNNWGSNSLSTYVEIAEDADFNEISQKIEGQIKKNNPNSITEIYLQPLLDIHLGEVQFVAEAAIKGNKVYVQMFVLISVIILLLACVNFMNLSTAKSVARAKEVGLRKTLGAHRRNLVMQFMGESIFMTILAMVIAILFADLLLPFFNELAGTELALTSIQDSTGLPMIVWMLGMTLLTGVIAGSYPSFVLSGFNPAYVLKGSFKSKKEGSLLRKILVTLQFSISVLLIIGTLVVKDQLNYMKNRNLGINKENIVYVPTVSNNMDAFKERVTSIASVEGLGYSNQHPAYVENSSSGFMWPGKNEDEVVLFHLLDADAGFMESMDIEVLEGRSFSNLPSDSSSIIVNQEAARRMGLENPVGVILSQPLDLTIIGVVKDFHFKSMHTRIEPLIMFNQPERHSRTFIRITGSNVQETLTQIEEVWKEFNAGTAFPYRFLDEDYNNLYQSEQQTSEIFSYFTLLAFLISGLGLFGLSSYAAEQRTKEISIRKVMGASSFRLFWLVSTDLTKLSLLSILVAVPIGWLWMNSWLEGFAYRTPISIWVFVIASLAGFLITFFTVSIQSLRVSVTNPVENLRNE